MKRLATMPGPPKNKSGLNVATLPHTRDSERNLTSWARGVFIDAARRRGHLLIWKAQTYGELKLTPQLLMMSPEEDPSMMSIAEALRLRTQSLRPNRKQGLGQGRGRHKRIRKATLLRSPGKKTKPCLISMGRTPQLQGRPSDLRARPQICPPA